ncbi:MAG: hypothetical protein HOV80_02955 [Polyangiaceae bacterium]|nr:hypothetical protein [Polyangiaceae bacterium]
MRSAHVLSLGLLLGSAACSPKLLPASASSDAVLIADAKQESDVRAAIVKSLAETKFATESEEGGLIRAKYQGGDEVIQIAVEYSGSQYRVRYLASEGLESQGNGADMLIQASYHKQVKNLKKHIERHLRGPDAQATDDAASTQPAEPAVDNRSPGQVIVDIIATVGYACTAEESRWVCAKPGDSWPITVSWVEEPGATTIWFDSYLTRAFAKRCGSFSNAVRDLAVPDHSFTASCNDDVQNFRLNTAVVYGADLDVTGWLKVHEADRATAASLLHSVRAIRK